MIAESMIRVARSANIKVTDGVVRIEPFAGQKKFLARSEYEVLFGGQPGPGKSWALVIDALGLQFAKGKLGCAAVEVPSYRAVIFRRKSTELSKLIDEGMKYYRLGAFGAEFTARRTGEPGASFTFPSGAKIFLCHLENEKNKYDHDGIEYQYVGWDELTHFTLTQYLYLMSRTRSTVENLFVRVRATANPLGEGLWWVRKRYPVKEPMVVKHYVADKDPAINPAGIEVEKSTKMSKSRVFVPGELKENIYLNQDEYVGAIKQMGMVYERALLHHDWDAFGGDFFDRFEPGREIIAPFAIPKNWRLVGSIDPGFSSPCSYGLQAIDPMGNIYRIATYYYAKRSPEEHADKILSFIKSCVWTGGRMPEMTVSGRDAWSHRDRYAVIASERTFSDVFASKGLILTEAVTDRVAGWWAWKSLMPAKWFVFEGMNVPLVEEITAAVKDERDVEDIKGKGNDANVIDHALDECRYAVMAMYKTAAPPKAKDWASRLFEQVEKGKKWRVGDV